MTDRPPISVHLLPSSIPPGALKGGVAVVADILRATTAMVHALASGCAAIIPCLEVDEARRAAEGLATGSTVLAGERQGIPIPGFAFGNSPSSFTPEACGGKTVVITTTNGTRGVHASLEADWVLVAAFVNLGATAKALAGSGKPIHIVCSGTDGLVSLEDTLFAGALVEKLAAEGFRPGNDSAEVARFAWASARSSTADELACVFKLGRGGRRVEELGFAQDIEEAASIDRFGFVAELRREPLRIVRVD